MHKGRALALVAMSALAIVVSATVAGAAIENAKPYAIGLPGTGYETKRLLSVGDTVPETSNPSKQFQMVGIPDGLGAHRSGNTRTIYMNHELPVSPSVALTEPVIGDPLNRGAFVSKLTVNRNGTVLSGERAYDTVYNMALATPTAQPAPEVGNATRPFSRFCSGDLAGPDNGFDRYVYITNEEEGTPANSFDTFGAVSVAIFDNSLYTLPKLGRFAWENSVVQPARGNRQTVIMGMEDGPADLLKTNENSQVYMYVGTKERGTSDPLNRNGLDNGKLYVLAPVDPTKDSEGTFTTGTIAVKWVEVPNGDTTTEGELETASDTAGALRFARPEDGAFNMQNRNEYFFVTTGESTNPSTANQLGRLYSLQIDRKDPTAQGKLTVLYSADAIFAAGGDIAVSPDNVGTSEDYLMINEDGTATSRLAMAARNRDGSIWRFDVDDDGLDAGSAKRVAELDPPGRDGIPVGPGVWETSGIIDGEGLFGEGSWIFDVQAHAPTTAPGSNTREDGQLLLLTRADDGDDDDDDDDEDEDDD